MNNVMCVLFASDNENKLNELTIHRTTASLPFCGRYRLIDFALSNLVNSGITNIGIVTRNNYNSLMDHIRMGRDWDLNRKNSGLVTFPPFVLNSAREMYKGKIEALYTILGFIKHSREDYVVLGNSNVAMNIDFEEVYDYHVNSGADITMLVHKSKPSSSRRIITEINKDNRITDILVSEMPDSEDKNISLNTYLINKKLLCELVENAYARGLVDLEKDILLKKVDELKMMAYEVGSYAAIIDDIKSYYNESMNALNADIRQDLFYQHGTIYTKVKDSAPTIYRDNAEVKNSLIADGCDIDGIVENSILFRGVKVAKGSIIRNSIIMENGIIGKNAIVSYAITDKNVTVKENRNLSGYETYPIVIVKGKVV